MAERGRLPTAKEQPRLPIYPRPVSPLHYEPLRPGKHEIFVDDSADSDSDEEARAAKKRRIEKLGEQYLRGERLIILSAGLKGPFQAWKNPWLKKKLSEKRKLENAGRIEQEVPETTTRLPRAKSIRTDSEAGKQVLPVQKQNRLQERRVAVAQILQQACKSPSTTKRATTGAPARSVSGASDGSVHTLPPKPTGRLVEEVKERPRSSWLRKDGSFDDFNTRPRDQSPTPAHPAKVRGPETSSPIPAALLPTLQRQHSPQENTTRHAGESRPVFEERYPNTNRSEILKPAMAIAAAPLKHMVEGDVSSKGRSLHTLLPSTELSVFEYRRASGPSRSIAAPSTLRQDSQPTKAPSGQPRSVAFGTLSGLTGTSSVDVQRKPHELRNSRLEMGQEKAMANEKEPRDTQADHTMFDKVHVTGAEGPVPLSAPPLFEETSTATTTTTTIPSAQPIPAVQLPHLGLNTSHPEISQEEPAQNPTRCQEEIFIPVTTQAAVDAAEKQFPADLVTPRAGPTPAKDIKPSSETIMTAYDRSGITPFSAFKSPPNLHERKDQLDKQYLSSGITPLGFSTSQKIAHDDSTKNMPKTATQAETSNSKKRASFAAAAEASSESSQGSIKSSLRVSKTVSRRQRTESKSTGRVPSPFGKLGLDMETSDEEERDVATGKELSSINRENAEGRLIKKPEALAIPAKSALSTNSTATGKEQDAQRVVPARSVVSCGGLDTADGFNLNAAIDDLGSFLGSWDPEKEARELDGEHGKKPAMRKLMSCVESG